MDPVSISATLSSIKLISDVLGEWRKGDGKITVTVDTVLDLTSAVLDAQDHAMAARQAQYDLMRRNDELERELQARRDRDTEKGKYEIINVGDHGAYVYAPKRDAMPGVIPHWLCQPCFDASKKSLLQFKATVPRDGMRNGIALWGCPVCNVSVKALPNVRPS